MTVRVGNGVLVAGKENGVATTGVAVVDDSVVRDGGAVGDDCRVGVARAEWGAVKVGGRMRCGVCVTTAVKVGGGEIFDRQATHTNKKLNATNFDLDRNIVCQPAKLSQGMNMRQSLCIILI